MTLEIVLFFISIIVLISFYIGMTYSISYGLIYSFLHIYVGIIAIANILSVFGAYTKPYVITFWILTILAVLIALALKKIKPWRFSRFLARGIIEVGWSERVVICIILISFFLCIYRAVVNPPTNTDSLVYHLPRAFYYYKLGKVTNIPSNYIVMNYTPPAGDIILSHMFILSDGDDRFVNFLQLPVFVVIVVVIRIIVLKLCESRKLAIFMALFVASIPLVILQSVTTQNDLLASGFVVLFMLFSLKPLGLLSERVKWNEYILIGISAGMAMYTKITTIVMMFPLVVIMFLRMLCKRMRKEAFLLFSAAIPVIFINLPYWIRNAIELNGDFLALKASAYMAGEVSPSVADYLGRLLLNVGYLVCGRFTIVNKGVIYMCEKAYRIIGATEYSNWETYFVSPLATQDSNPYGILLIIVFISVIAVLIKGTKLERLFSVSWLFAFFVTMIINKPFIPSISRYELPVIPLGVIIVGIAFKNMFFQNKRGDLSVVTSILLIVISISNIQYCNFCDSEQPVYRNLDADTYEERRNVLYNIYAWNSSSQEIMELIDNNNFTNIGIWEDYICGIYPFLINLKDGKYKVTSIEGKYGDSLIPNDLRPEIIVYVGTRDSEIEEIEYNENKYKLVYVGDYLHVNESQVYLYEAKSLL